MTDSWKMYVREEEIDELGHVGYDTHLRWFKEGHRRVLESAGFSFEKLDKEYGLRPMVRHLEIDYTAQLHKRDAILIGTHIENIGTTSLTYSNSVESAGSTACKAKITVVFVGSDGKPTQIPDPIRQKLLSCSEANNSGEKYDDFGAPYG